MKILHGIILLLAVKVSAAVQGVVGGSVTLVCPHSTAGNGGSYSWQMWVNHGYWGKAFTDSTKYEGTTTQYLTIKDLDTSDAGTYRCTPTGGQQGQLKLSIVVQGVIGSSATLECPKQAQGNTNSYMWQKWLGTQWGSAIQNTPKYLDATTKFLTINDLLTSDAGMYGCTPLNEQQGYVELHIIGFWSQWTDWTDCTTTCGGGQQNRTRHCQDNACTGNQQESSNCNTFSCADVWSEWTEWDNCTKSCDVGKQYRIRTCYSNPCTAHHQESRDCNTAPCPVIHGKWGQWSAWTQCSVTCGQGNWSRNRLCNSPTPVNGGDECQGSSRESQNCSIQACSVDGQWGAWEYWSECSVTCDGGTSTRIRFCDTPAPAHGGSDCIGNSTETESCSVYKCPAKSESSPNIAPAAAGASVGVLIIIVVIVIIIVCMKRRKQTPKQKERADYNSRLYNNVSDVTLRTETNHSRTYINLARPSRTSSSDTDDDLNIVSDSPNVQKTVDDSNVYHNVDIPSIRRTLTNLRVEELKAYIDKTGNEGLKKEYQNVPYGPQHPTTKAQLKDNMPKNRFKKTFPYDHTRVILDPFPGVENSDYVNANFVEGFEAERCYIASQGPVKFTLQDHWRMIWQYNTRKIIMLANLIEGGKVKCERYWPNGNKPMIVGNFVLTLVSEKERAAYITREISVEDRKSKEKRNVIQYHFTAWPDHGTPDPLYLVLFHKHVISDHDQIETGQLLVHCSAGIGRTGTFIALDALTREGRTTGFINILDRFKQMRYSRMNMIQTPEQYVCLHYALLEAFTMKDTMITKDQFSEVWREIYSDKRPINQQRLNEEFKMLEEKKAEHEKAEYAAALSTENIDKNRSRHSLPMDNKRLYLISFEKGRSDFINAVQAPSYTKFVGYLTTQLPLADTKVDFWTMVRDQKSSTIILILNNPEEIDLVHSASVESFTCGPFSLKITKRETRKCDITESTIVMAKKDDKPKEVSLYQVICKDMPDPKVLCRLVDLISTRISMSHDPVTVVSSDGAKNCGLFCAFTNAVSSMKIDEKVDIFQLVRLLQLRRPNFLADFEEYRRCYEALNFYLESTNVYANF